MSSVLEEDRRDDGLRDLLRREVGEAEFDYLHLIAGVHQRAGRLRRRRAVAAGAAVAVLGPALVGGATLVLPSLLPGGVGAGEVATLSHAAGGPTSHQAAPMSGSDEPSTPPFQAHLPPVPDQGVEDAGGGGVNAWDMPDARPTGVAFLDDVGVPRRALDNVLVVPLAAERSCLTGSLDAQPVAGQSWSYSGADAPDPATVDIQVTGWKDSQRARDLVRDQALTTCQWATGTQWSTVEEGEDLLLLWSDVDGLQLGFAVARQGDYLVEVAVTNSDGPYNADVAAEIATKTAANLRALDPEHARD
ncbi:hypothetical protein FNH13_04075 [Ornithinimicrobium ciconiae]|uniref:PknH-like extracellular domain-containing protein n=1 Tax=Ornithinimicrobium ciconiae TaxID=2594265 RepID=A0A516G7V9_9MICO|nr:hypothetical protein [Ornithinimicrobium ciconiae]QDO87616.1 hypothetical protein FNH13_04075 [Ornithinimicrobium ciconiae]